jgi:glycosyltransferase involved in cell wall biosynthesis
MGDTVSVILTVHNQEEIIRPIFQGLIENCSENVAQLIVVLDGCTDKSEEILNECYQQTKKEITICKTPNLNETLANNFALKQSRCDYSIIVQDDCLIQEKDFDKRMLKPFQLIPELLAVSGRDAVDTRLVNGALDYYNVGGKDVGTPRHIFSIRDAVNRSPLMLDNKKAKQLNYLDEDFAPLDSDDVDLSIRGYKEFGYLVGSYVIDFYSPLHWGKTRNNPVSNKVWEDSMRKNHKLIVDRHYDFIVGEKHSRDEFID